MQACGIAFLRVSHRSLVAVHRVREPAFPQSDLPPRADIDGLRVAKDGQNRGLATDMCDRVSERAYP